MIKKMTILREEMVAGDFPIAFSEDGYAIIYREIPEFGTSAKLNATQEELAKAKAILSRVNQTAHQYFAQARRLKELGADRLADKSVLHGERIQAALRDESLQNWPLPDEDDTRMPEATRAWNAWLSLAIDITLEDGTPLLTAVFEQNPELAVRLRKAIEEKK